MKIMYISDSEFEQETSLFTALSMIMLDLLPGTVKINTMSAVDRACKMLEKSSRMHPVVLIKEGAKVWSE